MTYHTDTPTIPWYRQFWPWFLLALPATAVIAGIATVIIAMQTHDTLVSDDYYKDGLAINQDLKREQLARDMGLKAHISVNRRNELRIQMSASEPLAAFPALEIVLTHPTLASMDIALTALIDRNGDYAVQQATIPAGHWYIRIEAPGQDWRLNGSILVSEDGDTQVVLQNR